MNEPAEVVTIELGLLKGIEKLREPTRRSIKRNIAASDGDEVKGVLRFISSSISTLNSPIAGAFTIPEIGRRVNVADHLNDLLRCLSLIGGHVANGFSVDDAIDLAFTEIDTINKNCQAQMDREHPS